LAGEGGDGVPVTECVERLAEEQQRLLLDVDDPAPFAEPAVRRPADVNQELYRDVAPGRSHKLVQPVVGASPGTRVGVGQCVGADVELVAVQLPSEAESLGLEPLEAPADEGDGGC